MIRPRIKLTTLPISPGSWPLRVWARPLSCYAFYWWYALWTYTMHISYLYILYFLMDSYPNSSMMASCRTQGRCNGTKPLWKMKPSKSTWRHNWHFNRGTNSMLWSFFGATSLECNAYRLKPQPSRTLSNDLQPDYLPFNALFGMDKKRPNSWVTASCRTPICCNRHQTVQTTGQSNWNLHELWFKAISLCRITTNSIHTGCCCVEWDCTQHKWFVGHHFIPNYWSMFGCGSIDPHKTIALNQLICDGTLPHTKPWERTGNRARQIYLKIQVQRDRDAHRQRHVEWCCVEVLCVLSASLSSVLALDI